MKRLLFLSLFLPLCAFSSVRELIAVYQEPKEVKQPPKVSTADDCCSCKAILDAEFLYWYANVTNLSYAYTKRMLPLGDTTDPTSASLFTTRKEEFDWNWSPGLRLGAGIVTPDDDWELYANWTYHQNRASETDRVPPFRRQDFTTTVGNNPNAKALSSPWLDSPNLTAFRSAKSKFYLRFNQFDLQLGKHFLVSPKLSLHPFWGLRGFFSTMRFSVKVHRPFVQGPSFQNQIDSNFRAKQQVWGIGPLGGVNTEWNISKRWSLFGGADIALAYGKYDVKQRSSIFQVPQPNPANTFADFQYDTRSSLSKFQTFAGLMLGLRWEKMFETGCRFLLDVGFESHFLLHFSQVLKGGGSRPEFKDLVSQQGNLILSGVVVRERFEF